MRKGNGISAVGISIIVAVVIIIVLVLFFVFKTTDGGETVAYETVADALASGEDIKCTYNRNGDTATYFFGEGMIRAEADSAGAKTYLILRPEGAIVWNAAQPPLTANATDTATFRAQLLASPLSDYDCWKTSFDYSVFTPPAQ